MKARGLVAPTLSGLVLLAGLTVVGGTVPVGASAPPTNVLSWGSGYYGEFGDGATRALSYLPVAATLPSGVTLTALTGYSTKYAVSATGTLYAWGRSKEGELGDNTTPNFQPTPIAVPLPGGVSATAVAAGGSDDYGVAFAIASNGTLYAWGAGPLGNACGCGSRTPVAVALPSGVSVTAVAAGGAGDASSAYAIGSDDTLYAWGPGGDGQLGNGTTPTVQNTPVAVSLPPGVTPAAVATQGASAYAIGSNGTLYAWGYGADGGLGNGTTTNVQSTPVAVSLPSGVTPTAIAAGGGSAYAIGSNGTLYAWGAGSEGGLGNGTTTNVQSTPVAVSLPSGVTPTAISSGQDGTTYAIGSDGTLYAWGFGGHGELGNGTSTEVQSTPVAVSLPAGMTPEILGPGSQGSVIVTGTLPPGPTITRFTPTSGPPGTTIKIRGTNLEGAFQVTIGHREIPIASDTGTVIKLGPTGDNQSGRIAVFAPFGSATTTTSFERT